jgi:hypothetical protein
MNCQEFESILHDLAGDRKMNEPTRLSGLAHAEACTLCAASLAEERTLLAGLRAVAANAASEKAPPWVERELRLAFRQQAVASSNPAIISPPSSVRHRPLWALGAVALILGALALSVPFRQRVPNPKPAQETQRASPPIRTLPASESPPPPLSAPEQQEPRTAAETVLGPKPNRARHPVRQNGKGHKLNRLTADSEVTASPPEAEIATDFLPLVYGPSPARLDRGQVVRIKLSRLALLSFGLPMNEARAREPIEAEVVLGEDGTARAIRFVH